MGKKIFPQGFLYKTGLDLYKNSKKKSGEPEISEHIEIILNQGLIPTLTGASDLDIRAAIDLTVARGCTKTLIRIGPQGDSGYLIPLTKLVNSRRFLNMHLQPCQTKLLKYFDCVHTHRNNSVDQLTNVTSVKYHYNFDVPSAIELTFYRKSLNKSKNLVQIPYPLDQRNNPKSPDLKLENHGLYINY